MYEFYQLYTEWNRLLVKQSEPWINSPLVDWYMDLVIESLLKSWFWHGTAIDLQDYMDGVISFTLGNLCKPN